MSKTYPQIPTPSADIKSLLTTVNVLKQVVEILTGQRGAAGVAAQIYFSDAEPISERAGAFWVTSVGKTRIWNGTQWIALAP